jgi:hypothetical protein
MDQRTEMQIHHTVLKRLDLSEFRHDSPIATGVAPRVGDKIEVALGDDGHSVPARVIAVQTISGAARGGGPPPRPTEVTVHAEELMWLPSGAIDATL